MLLQDIFGKIRQQQFNKQNQKMQMGVNKDPDLQGWQEPEDFERKSVSKNKSYGGQKIASSWVDSVNQDGDNVVTRLKDGSEWTTPMGSPEDAAAQAQYLANASSVGSAVNKWWRSMR